MTDTVKSEIAELLSREQRPILDEWLRLQLGDARRRTRLDEADVRRQSKDFLDLLAAAVAGGSAEDITTRNWDAVRRLLDELSLARAQRGLTPTDTALFVFSLKEPLLTALRARFGADSERLAEASWSANLLLDRLGLYTTEVHQKGREEVIRRQQQEMLELSTPVVALWEGVLALPLIGTLDSARTQVVMENLLQEIVNTGSTIAILDISGVPTVDSLVAQHLIKTVSATRLMGAECIISGIRPQIAQTIVHLGVELQDVVTKATLADAFAIALRRIGLSVRRDDPGTGGPGALPTPGGR